MNNHTSGNWTSKFHHPTHTGLYGHFQIRNEAGTHIASAWILEATPPAMAEANANLIALCPDLLSELKTICHAMHNKPELKEVRDRAIALINAAENGGKK